jgi:hypothetical protein
MPHLGCAPPSAWSTESQLPLRDEFDGRQPCALAQKPQTLLQIGGKWVPWILAPCRLRRVRYNPIDYEEDVEAGLPRPAQASTRACLSTAV